MVHVWVNGGYQGLGVDWDQCFMGKGTDPLWCEGKGEKRGEWRGGEGMRQRGE